MMSIIIGALPITEVSFGSTNFAPISLASVNCVGTEMSLLDCPTQGEGRLALGQTGFYQNDRDTPVGVRCEGELWVDWFYLFIEHD